MPSDVLTLENPGDSDEDYVLNGDCAWVVVGNVVLWIRKVDDEGDGAKSVSVEAFANGCEGEPPMDSLLVSCADAEAIREENEVCED